MRPAQPTDLTTRTRAIAQEVAAKHADDVDAKARFPQETIEALAQGEAAVRGGARRARRRRRGHARARGACARRSRRAAARAAWCSRCTTSRWRASRATACRRRTSASTSQELVERQLLIGSITSEVGVWGDTRSSICAVRARRAGASRSTRTRRRPRTREHADDLLVTARRNAGRAAERSGARARAQGRSHAHAHDDLGHDGHARHVQPGLQDDVLGPRGAGAAGLVRRRVGADDGLVLAHPVVGRVARHRERRRGARGRLRARRGAQDAGRRAAQGHAPRAPVGRRAAPAQQRARPGRRVRRHHVAPDGHGGAAHGELGAQDEQHQGRRRPRWRRASSTTRCRSSASPAYKNDSKLSVGAPVPRLALGGAHDLERPHLREDGLAAARPQGRTERRSRDYDIESFYAASSSTGSSCRCACRARSAAAPSSRTCSSASTASSRSSRATIGAEVYTFPPVIDRTIIEKTDYLDSFPQPRGHGLQLLRQGQGGQGAVGQGPRRTSRGATRRA